jgi:hypothetical protein
MIFLAIHKFLSVMSLSPRSDALSLIVTRGVDNGAGMVGLGTEGYKDESSRMEMTELMSGSQVAREGQRPGLEILW